MNLREHYYHTEGDGVLDTKDTDVAAVAAMVEKATQSEHIVLHIHGGLVSADAGIAKAARLVPYYEQSGFFGVFPVWETGILETIPNNLRQIANEKVFSVLLKKLLKWAVGKALPLSTAKAGLGPAFPNDQELAIELSKRKESEIDRAAPEPYAQLSAAPAAQAPTAPLTASEEAAFVQELGTDSTFQVEINAIMAGPPVPGAKARSATVQASSHTLMSPDVVEDLRSEKAKGALAAIKAAWRAAKVLRAVIQRRRAGHDHGLYTTIVEEILREFYLANAGAAVWGAMKQDAAETFQNVGKAPERGGWLFVKLLGEKLKAGSQSKVSVVAHSAGSIYTCHLLAHLAQARAQKDHPLPEDFKLNKLVFLAPAANMPLFADTLKAHRDLFSAFRMYSMSDALEAGYWEVPAIYPRSLLYLVSGVFETDETAGVKHSVADMPIVGMQRFYEHAAVYGDAATTDVRAFLAEHAENSVWSEVVGLPGRSSDAIRHGAFDSDTKRAATMKSVIEFLGEP